MADFNRVILMGRLTRDVELRYVGSGTAVTDVGIAVNDRRKNANGEWVEEVQFIEVTLWGRQAEVANEYLSKGSPIFIEGRLKFDQWETQDGQKRSKLRVVGERLQLLPRGGGGAGGSYSAPRDETEYSQPADRFEPAGVAAGTQPQEGGGDIPF